jgi:spore coat protein U-like protein
VRVTHADESIHLSLQTVRVHAMHAGVNAFCPFALLRTAPPTSVPAYVASATARKCPHVFSIGALATIVALLVKPLRQSGTASRPTYRNKDTTMKYSRSRLQVALGSMFVAAGLIAGSAHAGTATSNLGVSASVAANCTIATDPVAFGAYDPVSANAAAALNGTGTVTVACTSGSASTATLGQGANADTGSTDAVPLRRMKEASTTNYLSYALYQDSARTTVWGNTAGTGVAHTGTGSATAITVYGAVAANQNVPAGSYSDIVVATVSF